MILNPAIFILILPFLRNKIVSFAEIWMDLLYIDHTEWNTSERER